MLTSMVIKLITHRNIPASIQTIQKSWIRPDHNMLNFSVKVQSFGNARPCECQQSVSWHRVLSQSKAASPPNKAIQYGTFIVTQSKKYWFFNLNFSMLFSWLPDQHILAFPSFIHSQICRPNVWYFSLFSISQKDSQSFKPFHGTTLLYIMEGITGVPHQNSPQFLQCGGSTRAGKKKNGVIIFWEITTSTWKFVGKWMKNARSSCHIALNWWHITNPVGPAVVVL